jgi:hypothetical protein
MIRVEKIPILAAQLEEAEKKKQSKALRIAGDVDLGWSRVLRFDSSGKQVIKTKESSQIIAKERI